ncbi:MAG TPA: molybdenum cofactor guanylyltransferase MobA [Burkholderiales bacterium]|nr:molybdenum cofactor guanylyltransferase MobA [Burkholderiales bacterium]
MPVKEIAETTGLILAGGKGSRMGSVDKGLEPLRGKPMVQWVLERLRPQVADVIINANQNQGHYAYYGHTVVSDEIGGFAGPLAGLHAGLKNALRPYMVTVPCDSPFLPTDLVERLHAGLAGAHAELAVAKTGTQAHPVFALVRTSVLPHLERFLQGGGRKIDAWYASLKIVEVPFEEEAAFSNINTREELSAHDKA